MQLLPGRLAAQDEDRAGCEVQLKQIHEAIQAYRKENKELPDRLSALLGKYLGDPDKLVCPLARRSGLRQENDPRTSYFYEFGTRLLHPNFPGKTVRDWKERQMGKAGSDVPVVRCQHGERDGEGVWLNLSFGGEVYESGLFWEAEERIADFLGAEDLYAGNLFAHEAQVVRVIRISPRPEGLDARLIDLSSFFNAALGEKWDGDDGNDLKRLRGDDVKGRTGIDFDLRGVVQLANADLKFKFATSVEIPVGVACTKLHFLQGCGYEAKQGEVVGKYTIRIRGHEPGKQEIRYGEHVLNWWHNPGAELAGNEAIMAWEGTNEARNGKPLRLYMTTWQNPHEGAEVQGILFESNVGSAMPFLLGITAEP